MGWGAYGVGHPWGGASMGWGIHEVGHPWGGVPMGWGVHGVGRPWDGVGRPDINGKQPHKLNVMNSLYLQP